MSKDSKCFMSATKEIGGGGGGWGGWGRVAENLFQERGI